MNDNISPPNQDLKEYIRLKNRLKSQRKMLRIKADPERYKIYLEKCRNNSKKARERRYNDPEKYKLFLESNRIKSLRYYNERIRVDEEKYNKLKEYNKQYQLRIKNDPLYKEKQKEKRNQKRSLRRKRHAFKRLAKYANRQYKNGIITSFDLFKIAKKQRLICPFTGQRLTSDNVSADHIIPKSKGGLNVPSNIRLTTKPVNIARQNMTDEEFLNLCQLVVQNNYTGCK